MGNVWRYLHDDVDGKDLIKQMWTRFKSSIHIQLAFCFCYMVKVGLYAKEDDFILSTTLCQDERLPSSVLAQSPVRMTSARDCGIGGRRFLLSL